jgi:drug/metabolite transporter (DMT)-like permease
VTVGLLCAIVASVSYGIASIFQAIAAQRVALAEGFDPGLLARLATQWPFLVGVTLDGFGFVFNVIALRSLPLFLVESMVAASVGVTAVAAVLVMHVRLQQAEIVALSVLMLGVVFLAAGAKSGPGKPLSHTGEWVLLAAVPIVLVVGLAAYQLTGRAAVVTLAAMAGVSFGGVGVAARSLEIPDDLWRLLSSPVFWALAGFGILGMLFFAAALQRGTVTVVSAVMFAVETVLPSAIGFAFLGDETRPGIGVLVAGVGFVLTLSGAIALAPYAELTPEDQPASLPSGATS